MKLATPDDRNLFTLTVERYEFPDEELGPTEENPAEDFDTGRFLVVSHTFRNAVGEWQGRGPTMTTDELARFADWLEALSSGNRSDSGMYFTERDLEVTFDSRSCKLIVHVSFDFVPEWIGADQSTTIEFPLADVDLRGAITSIRRQLSEFPGRPPLQQHDRTMR